MYEQQKLQSVIAEQQIVLDVIAAFVAAAWYAREMQLDQTLVDLNHKRLDIILQEVALGLRLPQDTELALTDLEDSERRLESSRQDALQWRYQLAALLGRPSEGETLMLDGALPPLSPLPPLNRLLGQVMASHPAQRVQGEKIQIAREQYRIDRSTPLPTAAFGTSLTAAQNADYFNGGHGQRRPTVFLSYVQIRMPIFDFGLRRAATHESQEKVQAEQARLKQIDLDLRKAITQTYGEVDLIDKTLADLEGAYRHAENNAALVKAEREEGVADELTLVNARVAELNAEEALKSKQLEKRLRYAQLQNLAGGAWHWMQ